MEIKPLRTNEEIQKFIEENYGSYENYLSKRNEQPPAPSPRSQVVHKSAPETFLGLCDAKAKSLGITREAFFTRYPEMHRKYRELVTGDY